MKKKMEDRTFDLSKEGNGTVEVRKIKNINTKNPVYIKEQKPRYRIYFMDFGPIWYPFYCKKVGIPTTTITLIERKVTIEKNYS